MEQTFEVPVAEDEWMDAEEDESDEAFFAEAKVIAEAQGGTFEREVIEVGEDEEVVEVVEVERSTGELRIFASGQEIADEMGFPVVKLSMIDKLVKASPHGKVGRLVRAFGGDRCVNPPLHPAYSIFYSGRTRWMNLSVLDNLDVMQLKDTEPVIWSEEAIQAARESAIYPRTPEQIEAEALAAEQAAAEKAAKKATKSSITAEEREATKAAKAAEREAAKAEKAALREAAKAEKAALREAAKAAKAAEKAAKAQELIDTAESDKAIVDNLLGQ